MESFHRAPAVGDKIGVFAGVSGRTVGQIAKVFAAPVGSTPTINHGRLCWRWFEGGSSGPSFPCWMPGPLPF